MLSSSIARKAFSLIRPSSVVGVGGRGEYTFEFDVHLGSLVIGRFVEILTVGCCDRTLSPVGACDTLARPRGSFVNSAAAPCVWGANC
jgi:hypothetical protein